VTVTFNFIGERTVLPTSDGRAVRMKRLSFVLGSKLFNDVVTTAGVIHSRVILEDDRFR
jgi:hypothetical protein